MFDDAPPPAKRMRLHTEKKSQSWVNKENICPNEKPETRKRKIPIRRPPVSNILDLNPHVLLEVFEYLSVQGKLHLFYGSLWLQFGNLDYWSIKIDNNLNFQK